MMHHIFSYPSITNTETVPMDVTSFEDNSQVNDERERRQFTQEIHKFMAEVGKPLSKIPIMGYKELDLYQLYKEVIAHGGFNEVVKNVGTWSKIWKRLGNFDPSITDSSFRLKKNYERYLLEYEYKCFPDHRAQAMEYQEKSSMKRSASLNSNLNLSAPHSPSSSSSPASPFNSNTSSGALHHSESASPTFLRKKSKAKKRSSRSSSSPSSSPTPSRSSSNNNIAALGKPMVFGELTIECLGTIIPRYPYVFENQIYPVGFTSTRTFTSRLNPDREVLYTSMIVDASDRPQFVVIASDEPDSPYVSNQSPSHCWRMVLQQFVDTDDLSSSTHKISVSGHLRFGLTHPEVAALIRDLPNAAQAQVLFPPLSPSKRKYNYISDDSADEAKSKAQRNENSFSRGSNFNARDDADDLESAIATLQALKYCTVY